MDIKFDVKRTFKVGGKKYDSVEDIPADIRDAVKKFLGNNPGSGGNSLKIQSKIDFNGTEYESIEAMPPDVRDLYTNIMKAAESESATPLGSGFGFNFKADFTKVNPDLSQNPVRLEPVIAAKKIFIGVLAVVVLLTLYFVFYRGGH